MRGRRAAAIRRLFARPAARRSKLRRPAIAFRPRRWKNRGGDDRWSEGPPEDSANRWSAQAPLGDESSSSESVSQSSILPRGELEQPLLVRRPAAPLVWALIVLVLFLAALIGVIVLARSIRPWIDARRAAAQQATVEFWLPRLDKGPDEARREAARAIVALGPKALCRTLDRISSDPGDGPFAYAPGAVRALGDVGAETVPGLRDGLHASEPKVRAMAAKVLQQMGAVGREARDDLLATLDDPNRWVRYDAIEALGYLGPHGEPAVKRLAEFLSAPDLGTRRHAMEALGRIGPEAREAVGALEKAVADDPDLALHSSAALALKQIDVAALARDARREATGEMKAWLAALAGDEAPAAVAAAEAVGKLGFEGRPAAAGLAAMLHDADRKRRLAAAAALGQLGLAAADFIPTLEAAVREDDAEVRAAAAKALLLVAGKHGTDHQ